MVINYTSVADLLRLKKIVANAVDHSDVVGGAVVGEHVERYDLVDWEASYSPAVLSEYGEIYRNAEKLKDLPKRDYMRTHALRFAQSLKWLRTLHESRPSGSLNVIEVGGESAFTPLYKAAFPNDNLISISNDLRRLEYDRVNGNIKNGNVKIEDGSIDLILCMEVFEHVIENYAEDQICGGWYGNGTAAFLKAVHALLKEKGLMFLTTPNLACATCFLRLVSGMAAMLHRGHVREYTVPELLEQVSRAGFAVDLVKTYDFWRNKNDKLSYKRVKKFIKDLGGSLESRGEDIFLLVSKSLSINKG